jgi:hypothetical protein
MARSPDAGSTSSAPWTRVSRVHTRRGPLTYLRAWLDDIEAFWTLQLDSFKAHAERTRGRNAKRGRRHDDRRQRRSPGQRAALSHCTQCAQA